MNYATQSLLKKVVQYGTVQTGKASTDETGIQYRYDKYEVTEPQNWLVGMFERAAHENTGKVYTAMFHAGDNSFSYERNPYKGTKNGRIRVSVLVLF